MHKTLHLKMSVKRSVYRRIITWKRKILFLLSSVEVVSWLMIFPSFFFFWYSVRFRLKEHSSRRYNDYENLKRTTHVFTLYVYVYRSWIYKKAFHVRWCAYFSTLWTNGIIYTHYIIILNFIYLKFWLWLKLQKDVLWTYGRIENFQSENGRKYLPI